MKNTIVKYAIVILCSVLTPGTIASDTFQIFSCDENGGYNLSIAHVFKTELLRNQLECAHHCVLNNQCVYAVYDILNKTCQLVTEMDNPPTVLTLHDDLNYCSVLGKYQDNLPENKSCVHDTYSNNGLSEGEWTLAAECHYPILATSQTPMKMIINSEEILTVNVFEKAGDKYVAQANNIYGVDDIREEGNTTFVKTEVNFKLCSFPPWSCQTAMVRQKEAGNGVETHVVDYETGALDVKLYFQNTTEETRLIINKKEGSILDITTAIKNGYGLLQRDLIFVSLFNSDVSVEHVKSRLRIVGQVPKWQTPLSFVATIESIRAGKLRVVNHLVGVPQGGISSEVEIAKSSHWELDTNWRKLTEPTLAELQNYTLSGVDMRVIINGTSSFDVHTIQVSTKDIAVQLMPFLNPLVQGSHYSIVHTIMSYGKKMSICEADFQGSEVHMQATFPDPPRIDWVISTRNWAKIFIIKDGAIINGTENNVIQAAISGKNLRVCVITKNNPFTFCHFCMSIKMTQSYGLVCQSRPYFTTRPKQGFYDSFYYSDCSQGFRLISTQGWSVWIKEKSWTPLEKPIPLPNKELHWFAPD